MTYEEMMKIEYSKGEKAGEQKSTNNILSLISLMNEDGLATDIPRLSTDEEFLKEMLQKYQL